MKNLETIADELFNKIRGRFPSITVGNESAEITNKPKEARFFEFDFASGKKVSVSIDENALTVMYGQDLFSEDEHVLKSKWFDLLKELRVFAKKRMLNFDTRDITKSNLDKRDYEYLSTEKQMSESKMYGTSRTSYQDIGSARLIVKHAGPVNHENAAGRTQNVHSIYIESADGERFKYPLRHMNGARAMAMHVSEGGNAYDDFGKHIVGLSEEMNKLRKFKTYMNRSSVMAEGLAGYMDVVNERLVTVKKTVESLQRKTYYKEAFENFETTVLEEVPEDVSNTWIDELTIKQFNEELKGVFPYVYNLVKEANKVQELGPEEIVSEGGMSDVHIDAQEMSKEEFVKKYPTFAAMWDEVHADDDDDMGAPNEVIDPQTAYAQKMDDIIAQSKHEQGPQKRQMMTAEEQQAMWEKFSQCAADAASKGEKEFMFAGKKYKTTMSKLNAEKILGKRTDELTAEDQSLKEALPLLGLLIPAAGAALRTVAPRVLPGMLKGAKNILGWSAKNPVKATVGGVAAANPSATVDVAKGAVDTVKGGAELVGKAGDALDGAGEVIDKAKTAIDDVGGKVVQTADELKDMAGGALDNIPNLNKVVDMAKQYALPGAVVVALLLGGYKVFKMMFGDDAEKAENDKDAMTIDISPKGNGDELKKKNEIPLEEFIKGMYDYTSNAFPKGETAVLTAVQKQYGTEMVDEAQAVMADLLRLKDAEMARIQSLAGLR
ncbi:MAG: hypothetical protein CMD92_08655 [Gammaproteobacteria bacterium]|nr:hypothetical protein [Gammaproteobacteria bacterium]